MRRPTISLIILGALAANAQDLSKEITLDRTVLPEQRQAVRPALLPTMLPVPQQDISISVAEYLGPGQVSNLIDPLPPYPWRSSIPHTPYRGYASLGYFPSFNLGANAGYRFVDSDRATVGAWLQYNGHKYSGHVPYRSKVDMRAHQFTLGADGSYRPDANSRLSIALGYAYTGLDHPGSAPDCPSEIMPAGFAPGQIVSYSPEPGNAPASETYKQSASQVNGSAKWESLSNNISYAVGIGYDHFGFGKPYPLTEDLGALVDLEQSQELNAPYKQGRFSAEASVGLVGESSSAPSAAPWVGIDADIDVLSTNKGASTMAETHLRPYARFSTGSLTARLGINASIATGSYDTGLRIAPDVRLDWAPADRPVAAFVSIGGSEQLNPLADLFAADPYLSPLVYYNRSYVAASFDGGLSVGRIAGFAIDFYAGYAVARHQLLPMLSPSNPMPYGGTIYTPVDGNAWHLGAQASYCYQSLLEIYAGIEAGGSDCDQMSWYQWADRAKTALNMGLRLSPIEHLNVHLGYSVRSSRRGYYTVFPDDEVDLGRAENLSLGASYRVTQAFTVFAHAENLTNSHYMLISGLPAQGVKGLVGAAIKF